MKRLFRKDNRIARFIAMWLVFIMALTPLYEHSGLKNPTKAATGTLEYDLTVDVGTLVENGVTVTHDAENDKYLITGDGVAHKLYYFALNDNITVNVTAGVTGVLTYVDPSAAVVNPTFEYAVKEYQADETVTTSFVDSTSLIVKDGMTATTMTLSPGETCAIYVKVNEFQYLDADGTTTKTALDTNNTWELLTSYTLERQSKLLSSGRTLATDNVGTPVANAGGVYNEVYATTTTMENSVAAGDLYVGDVLFYYGPKAENGSTSIYSYDLSKMSVAKAGEKLNLTSDGEYIAFATYKGDSDETSVTYPTSVDYSVIEIDNTEPEMVVNSDYPQIRDYNDSNNRVSKIGNKYYLDTTHSYVYWFQIKEENATGLIVTATNIDDPTDTKTYSKVNGPTYQVQNIQSGLTVGETYKLTVFLEDKIGNTYKLNNGNYELDTITIIDRNLNVSGSVTDGTSTNSFTSSQSGTTFPKKDTSVQQRLNLKITSGYSLQSLTITAHNGKETVTLYDYSDAVKAVTKSEEMFTYELKDCLIPKEYGVDSKWTDIKITVKDSGNQNPVTKTLGELNYDVTAPKIDLENVSFQQGQVYEFTGYTEWKNVNKNHIQDGTYSIDLEKTYLYKYGITISDGDKGSGISYVRFYRDEEKKHKIGESAGNGNGVYYVTVPTIDTTTNEDLTTWIGEDDHFKLYVEAVDKAGKTAFESVRPIIIESKEELTIDSVKLTTGTGEVVEVDAPSDYYNNKAFKLYVEASSKYPIDKVNLFVKSEDGTTNNVIIAKTLDKDEDNDYDEIHLRYKVVCTIDIPENIVENMENMLFDSLWVEAIDTKTTKPQRDERLLGDLLYDASLPKLIDPETKAAFEKDDTWVKGASTKVVAVITPGGQAVESEIVEASYAIDDGSTTTEGVQLKYKYPTGENEGEEAGKNNNALIEVNVPESKTASGTKVTFYAKDEAQNSIYSDGGANVIYRRVDNSKPVINKITVNEKEKNSTPVRGNVQVKASVQDNLSIDYVVIDVNPISGTSYDPKEKIVSYGEEGALNETSDKVVREASDALELPDGVYEVKVSVVDKAGWTKNNQEQFNETIQFTVDNTPPEVTATIVTEPTGKTADFFKNDKVVVKLTCKEKNNPIITVTDRVDGGEPKKVNVKWTDVDGVKVGTYEVSTDGLHLVKIEAYDEGTENHAESKSVTFTRDTVEPRITAILNGGITYNESDGVRVFTTNTTLAFSENELNKDLNDFKYQLTKAVPDETPIVGQSKPTPHRSFTYTDEAEYTVVVKSTDMANNTSASRTVRFRIDKTAPNISIGGIASGGTSSNPVTISLNMQELYWSEATGTVEIYKKSGEGFGEELVETINYTPTGRSTSISRNFAESGIYRIEFNANDSAGHTSTASSTFTIDTTAPKVTLSGVSNYDVTDKDVTIESVITENFYASKKVTITGTVTDETGKVSPI
ncbi:MAG: hypothetical protein E7263_11000, partial [Lachnospiraceae bacterium]|nr:hypothetical protein [Lachnospiraceae bacterium]